MRIEIHLRLVYGYPWGMPGSRKKANYGKVCACSRPGHNQFAGDWKVLNPGKRLVGRAFTVQFMPARPDVAEGMQAEATKRGIGRLRNQTVIDMLGPNDVIIVDLFGKTDGGTFVGDNLSTTIASRAKTGMVIHGGIRDLATIFDEDHLR